MDPLLSGEEGSPQNGVPNRYFGCFQDNRSFARTNSAGSSCAATTRRRSSKPFKKNCSRASAADDVAACRDAWPDLVEIYAAYQTRIRSCSIPARELAFTSAAQQRPVANTSTTPTVRIAARQLAASGITLHPGETIQYVIASAKDKVKDWRIIPLALAGNYFEYDVKKYLELLERAFRTITEGLFERNVLPKPTKPRQMELELI